MRAPPFLSRVLQRITRRDAFVWGILALLVVICAAASPVFLKPGNLRNVFLIQPIGLGLAALGQVFIVISGGIDLSVGSVISLLTSLAAGIYKGSPGLPPVAAAAAMLACGCAIGAINGLIVVKLRVTPFMATLATMSIFQGAALFYAKKTIGGIPLGFRFIADGTILGIPVSIIIFLVFLVLSSLILKRHRLGAHLYAVGADIRVARLSGIPVDRIRLLAYVIGGALVAVSSIFLAARMGGGGPKVGVGYEMDTITAIVIGGVSLAGGAGSVFGAFGGVLIIGVFSNLMNLLNINPFYQIALKGVVLILAVAFYSKKKSS